MKEGMEEMIDGFISQARNEMDKSIIPNLSVEGQIDVLTDFVLKLHESPRFKPGELITQTRESGESAHGYRSPLPGYPAIVVANIEDAKYRKQEGTGGGPVTRQDIVMAVIRGDEVLMYFADSSRFEKWMR